MTQLEPFYLKCAILVPGARALEMGRKEDACYDLWSIEDCAIPPLSSGVFKCGFATEWPKSYVGLVLDRSGMGFKGSMRRAGVIDSGWRGEWRVCLFNSSTEMLNIESVIRNPKAKAAAQVLFVARFKVPPQIVDPSQLVQSERGETWQGATDVSSKSP
jgi:dUTP pyrophosphatase